MAYLHFKPTIWSKFIQTEAEKACKLVEDCNTQFEGEAKHASQVKILGIAAPTISDYDQGTGLAAPETPQDSSQVLNIDQAKSFNFMVDDIDKAQGGQEILKTLCAEAAKGIARVRDSFVASLAKNAEYSSESTQVTTAKQAKALIDDGILALREKDVNIDDDVTITISPFFYRLFRDELIELKTDNDELIRKGVVGMYDNCKVKLSNNLYNDGTDDYMMIRTKKAIAFASGIDETEAYRPENFFSDAVKGLSVYGGKIVRPKELYVIKAHK